MNRSDPFQKLICRNALLCEMLPRQKNNYFLTSTCSVRSTKKLFHLINFLIKILFTRICTWVRRVNGKHDFFIIIILVNILDVCYRRRDINLRFLTIKTHSKYYFDTWPRMAERYAIDELNISNSGMKMSYWRQKGCPSLAVDFNYFPPRMNYWKPIT